LQHENVENINLAGENAKPIIVALNTDKQDIADGIKMEPKPPVVQAPPTVVKQEPVNSVNDGSKVVYLTFDDGPSPKVTPLVLNVLKQENVKATFFIVGSMAEKYPSLLKQEKQEGHAIGNHTYSHDYKYVYSSTNNFISDLKKGDKAITSVIGDYNRNLIRFPGGSFNKQTYKNAAQAAGYHYVDWNCLTGDAEVSLASKDRLLARFKETFSNQKQLTILMHDALGKSTTPDALPEVIKFLKAKGYTFKTLQ
jgi:peptidoglycan/xylan/chitin deacetylase (PgdA/CDA1 family)